MSATCGKLKQNKASGETLENQILQRLDRLETKMDDLGKALLELAKTEERVIRLMEADDKKTDWLVSLQDRIVDLEKERAESSAVARRIERIIWLIITAGLSGVIAYYFSKP